MRSIFFMFWGLGAFVFFKVFGNRLLFLSLKVASATSQLEFSCVRTIKVLSSEECCKGTEKVATDKVVFINTTVTAVVVRVNLPRVRRSSR